MHGTIENEFFKVAARCNGAELTSVFCKTTQTEHLWQADPAFWGWYAPVLFPVVGRCLNDSLLIDGKSYRMEKHGFARKSNFNLLSQSDTEMVFELRESAHTLKMYPFHFSFCIAYSLLKNRLSVNYQVKNEDNKTMHFQLGGHPAFAVPFGNSGVYSDYRLEFEKTETISRHFISDEGFFTGETATILNGNKEIRLNNQLFAQDALIFKDHISREVTIRSKTDTRFLRVNFRQFPYIGFWAKENAPYVCIEPWIGCAESEGDAKEFYEREMVEKLPPGKNFKAGFYIEAG